MLGLLKNCVKCYTKTDALWTTKIINKLDWNKSSHKKRLCRTRPDAVKTRSSAIAEGPRDASCQFKSYQLSRNSAETTYTTSPDQIDGMKLEI